MTTMMSHIRFYTCTYIRLIETLQDNARGQRQHSEHCSYPDTDDIRAMTFNLENVG